ncbi:MAG: hypothetical protein V1737_01025 [Chloroflexota bacterium]
MDRGSVVVKPINCDKCGNQIEYGKNYIIVLKGAKEMRLCPVCALKTGRGRLKAEKGKEVVTFLEPSSG